MKWGVDTPSNIENRLMQYKIPGATVQPYFGDGPPNDTDDLTDLDNAIKNISRSISIVAGLKSRFEEKFKYLDDKKIASKTSLSHYQDTDFALETSEFTQAKIKQQTASSMLTQSNAQAQLALNLLP
jgi:flagellin-like hook-associated protein FlgL